MRMLALTMMAAAAEGSGARSSASLGDDDGGTSPDGGVVIPSTDSGTARADAGRERRPRPRDAGPPSDMALGEELTCRLDRDEALDAIVRHVACSPDSRATVLGLYEAWEAGLFGIGDAFAGDLTGFRTDYGCDLWRCLADAPDCSAHEDCLGFEAFAELVSCEPGADRCEPDGSLSRCNREGTGFSRMLDCAALGLRCGPSTEIPGTSTCLGEDGCELRGHVYDVTCDDGDLTACDGTLRLSCDEWRDGTSCRSFAIGGEVPIDWCAPEGFGGAGAYASPVECAGGAIRFRAVGAYDIDYDCRARGYSGCDERGCVP